MRRHVINDVMIFLNNFTSYFYICMVSNITGQIFNANLNIYIYICVYVYVYVKMKTMKFSCVFHAYQIKFKFHVYSHNLFWMIQNYLDGI